MTDSKPIQDPEPFIIPSTGFLLEFDQQVYEVVNTATHVSLERDVLDREQHRLDIRIQAIWAEEGYQAREQLL